METHAEIFTFSDADIKLNAELTKNFMDRQEFSGDYVRPDTPSSDASTSGVCSMASYDSEESEDNGEEKVENPNQVVQRLSCLEIMYEKRNILNIFENIYPYSVFQTTNVPKMNMSNYWERRSIYHRLGPYGNLDEMDFQKCFLCDFYSTVPKRL